MLVDTHCHLHAKEWFPPQTADKLLKTAHEQGVEQVIVIGTDPKDSENAQKFAEAHKSVYWTYGIHPEYARQSADGGALSSSSVRGALFSSKDSDPRPPEKLSFMASEGDKAPLLPVAIGEIGLDYHYDGYDRDTQIKLFEQMLQLARDAQLPVSLHIREAFEDAFAILDNFPELRGVVHSFTGSKKDLKKALARNYYIGVNGLVTYTTPPLPPLEKMLLETDAPFLTPVPFRGTINAPEYVRVIADYLAEKLGVAAVNIAEQTTTNAKQLFQL